jgi:hypothetical protein
VRSEARRPERLVDGAGRLGSLSALRGPRAPPRSIRRRAIAQNLPRSYEVLVRGQIKFQVGQIVWLALSKDGERMGCGFPKEMRRAAVEAEPHKFQLPDPGDMRFNWIHVRLDAIDAAEMRDLVEEAWWTAVPLYVEEETGGGRPAPASRSTCYLTIVSQ